MAKHKGSVFGALGEEPQPSSEQLRRDDTEMPACNEEGRANSM